MAGEVEVAFAYASMKRIQKYFFLDKKSNFVLKSEHKLPLYLFRTQIELHQPLTHLVEEN